MKRTVTIERRQEMVTAVNEYEGWNIKPEECRFYDTWHLSTRGIYYDITDGNYILARHEVKK